jgi:hypothetical protein
MNIRILNKGSAWKIAGKQGIIRRKRKETMRRERMDRNAEIKKIKKIEINLIENSGVKN